MKKFEYARYDNEFTSNESKEKVFKQYHDFINALGAAGWEIVQDIGVGKRDEVGLFVFEYDLLVKRELKDTKKTNFFSKND